MKKYIYYLWMIVAALAVVSCEDDDEAVTPDHVLNIPEERGAEPGTEYNVEEGVKYLNVVYLVPQDMQPREDWHWRLSGIMNHVQEFYKDRLSRVYDVKENFQLLRNKANPDYVNILLVNGKQASGAYRSITEIQNDVKQYFREHADQNMSHHTLVLLPDNVTVESEVAYGYDAANIPNEYLAAVACDGANFNIKYFGYTQLRVGTLKKLGDVIRATGLAMGMTYNRQMKNDVYTSITSLSGDSYIANPDKWRLTPADKEMLTATELFQAGANYSDLSLVSMNKVTLKVANNNLQVTCQFTSSLKPAVLFVYNDFFRAVDDDGLYSEEKELRNENMETVKDVMIYFTKDLTVIPSAMGNVCMATVEIPLSGIPDEYLKVLPGQEQYAKAELRFRILHENGTYTPSLPDTKCGTFYYDAEVHPDRFRYFYYLTSLGSVVQPMPYDPPYPDNTQGDPKSEWTISSEGYMDGVLKGILLDGKTDLPMTFNDWSVDHKTKLTVNPGKGYLHGIKIYPGNLYNRVNKVSVDVSYEDWDGDFGPKGELITRRMVDNYKLFDNGGYYYHIEFKPGDATKRYLVHSFTITLEDNASGGPSISLAEIGTTF